MGANDSLKQEIHLLIENLLNNLRLDGGPDPDTYTNMLVENIGSFTYDVEIVGNSINCLSCKDGVDKKELKHVYRELLVYDIHYANVLVYFLSLLQNQPHLLYMLSGLLTVANNSNYGRINSVKTLQENSPSATIPLLTVFDNQDKDNNTIINKWKRSKKSTPLIKKSVKAMENRSNLIEKSHKQSYFKQKNKTTHSLNISSLPSTNATPSIESEMSKLDISFKDGYDSNNILSEHLKLPKLPEWFLTRNYMKYKIIEYNEEQYQQQNQHVENTLKDIEQQLKNADIDIQEMIAIEDLLFLFMGIQGKFIHLCLENDSYIVKISSSFDTGIKELIASIIPLIVSFQTITTFLNDVTPLYDGRVAQALSEAVEILLKEYMSYICNLESQYKACELTLQSLVTHAHSCINQLQPVERLCNQLMKEKPITSCKIIDILYESYQLSQCAGILDDLFDYLLDKTCVPFFESLHRWIFEGVIFDPYNEFMVECNDIALNKFENEQNDVIWEKRYVLVSEKTPNFIKTISEKILSTGKYLNIIRQFDKNINFDIESIPINLSKDSNSCKSIVENAYNQASAALLQLLVQEKQLLLYLRSLKHYFMCDQGDFYVLFMDSIENELEKPLHDVVMNKLESSLEIALSLSVCSNDPYKDNLRVVLLPTTLQSQLLSINNITKSDRINLSNISKNNHNNSNEIIYGYEAFSFSFNVPWPLSLIINRKALIKYQMLFRLTFLVKRAERLHTRLWEKCIQNKLLLNHHMETSSKCTSFNKLLLSINNKLLHFFQSFEYYLAFEVIEPNWQNLEYHLRHVRNVDQVIQYHDYFLAQCISGFLLNNEYLIERIFELLSLSESFFSAQLNIFDEKNFEENLNYCFSSSHQQQLLEYDTQITQSLVKLIQLLRDDRPLSVEQNNNTLASRIDQNGYYSYNYNVESWNNLSSTATASII